MVLPKNRKTRIIPQLFWTFLRIGPSTFGGGYAMISVIESEIVEKRRWIDEKELAEMVSLAGSAPGGVGVNAAAFVGCRKAGVAGAAAAVAGVTLPTFVIVILLSAFYFYFQGNPKVEAALQGIHGAVVGLILMAAYRMAKFALFDAATVTLSILALTALLLAGFNPFYVLLCGLFTGIVIVKGKQFAGIEVRMERKTAKQVPVYPEYYI